MSCVEAQSPIPPEKPPTLNVTLRTVAKLGGFLGRIGDGEPGPQTLWRGLQRLNDIKRTWALFSKANSPPV